MPLLRHRQLSQSGLPTWIGRTTHHQKDEGEEILIDEEEEILIEQEEEILIEQEEEILIEQEGTRCPQWCR